MQQGFLILTPGAKKQHVSQLNLSMHKPIADMIDLDLQRSGGKGKG